MLSATTAPWWLWVVFTLVAATAQTFRNAAQRSLIDSLGTVGATHTRFIFGLPFGILFLLVVGAATGGLPQVNVASFLWTALGAVSQIAATVLMLAAMRERSFVVTIAYTKTEPVQVAVFATVFLGEHITPVVATAIIIATAGVIVLSWPSRAGREVFSWRPALLGIGAGALFALAAVGFRGGIVAHGTAEFVPAAAVTLAVSLSIQTVLLTAWLAWREPKVLRGIFAAWRVSLPAGALGAFASQMWFLAFAIQNPAKVRTLALVEIVIAGLLSRRLFAQTATIRDIIGMVLVVAGIVLLFNDRASRLW
jgi:drug/metabolite transporter (DMT)-like permease